MSPLQFLVVLTSLITYASFVWSFSRFFSRPASVSPQIKWIQAFGIVAIGGGLFEIGKPGNVVGWTGALGFFLFVLSLTVFWTAWVANRKRPLAVAFSNIVPEHFVKSGPYQFVRHPFYLSYLIAWGAGAVATRCLWLSIPMVILGVVYLRAATFEESQFARSIFAGSYRDYQMKTGMFFPRPRWKR